MDLVCPPVIEGYSPLVQLGGGGQASVFQAVSLQTGCSVAIKMYFPETDPRRILLELDTLRNLKTDHFPKVHGTGTVEWQGAKWIWGAFQFIQGSNLLDKLRTESFSEQQACDLALDVSDALNDLWRLRRVHRDVNPKNIMCTPKGDYVLIDLGLVKRIGGERITTLGYVVGTPGYMAPEQAMGRDNLTVKADVFGLGVTLYQALTGLHPYSGMQSYIVQAVPVQVAPLVGISEELRTLILRALSWDPLLRPMPIEFINRLKGV